MEINLYGPLGKNPSKKRSFCKGGSPPSFLLCLTETPTLSRGALSANPPPSLPTVPPP